MAARRGSIIPLVIAGLLGLVLVLLVRQWVGGGEGAIYFWAKLPPGEHLSIGTPPCFAAAGASQ